jgi:hypothetical protein
MFGQDRDSLRQFYLTCWEKMNRSETLTPLEQIIAEVIQWHPEYHQWLSDPQSVLDRDFNVEQGESNPFLHMGMHIAIREQLGAQRPDGIVALYQQLCVKAVDHHDAEHQMMECMGMIMWEAQRSGVAPDEQNYLQCLKKLI